MRLEVRKLLKEKGRSFLLILVLLAVLALVGCGSPETKVSADKVVQDALAAQAGVTASHVEITVAATAQGTMNGSSLDAALDATVNGDIDWANKKMKANIDANVDYNGLKIPVSAEMYVVDNYTYTKINMVMMTDNWSKSVLPVDFWQTLDNTQFINGILQSTEVGQLKEEKVGSVNCYVLQLKPDVAAIQQMLSQQSSAEEGMPNMEDIITNLSFKVWVAKDTSYVTKIEIVLSAHIPAGVLSETVNLGGLDMSLTITDISLTITMEATEFNQSVSIQLPDEAKNADEGEGFELPF
jgi:hypothetical protein